MIAGGRRAQRVLLAVLTAELVVLVVTGIVLYFEYRPSGATAWAGLMPGETGVPAAHRVSAVHRLVSILTLPTAIAAGVVHAFGSTRRRLVTRVAVAAGFIASALVASFTGYLLPWDQLALRAVTVGTNIDGYGLVFSDQVRFVIVDGVEVSTGTILRWLMVHVTVGVCLAVLTAVAWRRHREPDLTDSSADR